MEQGVVGEAKELLWHDSEKEKMPENPTNRRDVLLSRPQGRIVEAWRCTYCGHLDLFCPE